MEATRILWSGLTGRAGRAAIMEAANVPGVEIVAGMKRFTSGADDCHLRGEVFEGVEWFSYDASLIGLYGLVPLVEQTRIDVVVDFSHPNAFDKTLELAVRTGKPLVSGTSHLSNRQMASLYDATNRIPVFRGGNFCFKVKKFIDEAVELAQNTTGALTLYENFYEGKSLPSQTSGVVQRRIAKATGKTVEVKSWATFDKESLICDWLLVAHHPKSPPKVNQGEAHCRTIGFDELAHDVLEIAKVMAHKPIKPGEFYGLDELWDNLVSWAL